MAKSCRKCATDQPHPFRHWHTWCGYCRRPKIFRGPSCEACYLKARLLVAGILKEI